MKRMDLKNIQTGEVYSIYSQACRFIGQNALTQRRVSGLISNLDMLGLITARTISKGRYGRSKEINSCIPQNIDPRQIMINSEPKIEGIFTNIYKYPKSFVVKYFITLFGVLIIKRQVDGS